MILDGVKVTSEAHLLELTRGLDETTVNGLLALYKNIPYERTAADILFYDTDKFTTNGRVFGEELLRELTRKNVADGANAVQGLWAHQRLKSFDVNLSTISEEHPDITFKVDVIHLLMNGNIELAHLSMQCFVPDDMSLSHHWLSRERVDWAIDQMGRFISGNS